MRRGHIVVWLLAALALAAPSLAAPELSAQRAQRADLIVQFDALIKAGKPQEAQAVAERGLADAISTDGPNSLKAANWHYRLASAYRAQKKFPEAIREGERALQIQEKQRGIDHIDNTAAMIDLALSYTLAGRGTEAERLLKRVVAMYEKKYGPERAETAQMLELLAVCYSLTKRYEQAIEIWRRVLAIREKRFGAESRQVGDTLYDLARDYERASRILDAETSARRAVAILDKVLRPDDLYLARVLQFHGLMLEELARFAEAETLYKRTLAIRERAKAPAKDVVATLGRLGVLYQKQERLADAETHARRALALSESTYGKDSDESLWLLTTLGTIFRGQGRYADAEGILGRAIAIAEKIAGPSGANVAEPLGGLAAVLIEEGRLTEAELHLKRVLQIVESAFGADDAEVAVPLANLGTLYLMQNRFAEAEPALRRALAILERASGPDHPDTATALANLATLLSTEGRDREAEPLFRRALAILERAFGPDNPAVAMTLFNIAGVLRDRGDSDGAEKLLRRALVIIETARGPSHPLTATALSKLAFHLTERGRYVEAEPLLLRAKVIFETTVGPDHADVAEALADLGWAYWAQQKLKEAEVALSRALVIYRKALPLNHRRTNDALYAYAAVLFDLGKQQEAYAAAKEAATTLAERWRVSTIASLKGGSRERLRSEWMYVLQVRAAYALARGGPASERALRDESFAIAQRVGLDDTAQAVGRVASLFSADTSALGALLREQQNLLQRLAVVDQLSADALGSNEPGVRAQAAKFRQEADTIRAKLATLDATLRRDHKAYAELIVPQPVSLAEAQALLGGDEAIAMIVVGERDTYLFAVSKTSAVWARSALTEADLKTLIATLRRQLDPDQWQTPLAPFDRALAHRLYRELWAPLEPALKGKSHVFVVPTGPLTSLPLSVLVTDEPQGGAAADASADALRATAWLVKRHALTTLPSISSLKALRQFSSKGRATEPFAGFGDPTLGGEDGAARSRSVASVYRGAAPNLDELRTLPPLPATALELKSLAKALGASEAADVFLRERATEMQIKSQNLARKRVVAFATHALMAGDLGFGEPGLVFTPPRGASETDDGYLSASEAARLDLKADWIILSACNTAAGDTPGAKGLSGLARAFFLAGARSLLVSHWSVWDDASARITTTAVKSFQANRTQGRAEALRQASLALLSDGSSPRFAHPAAWAAFVLVGEPRAN